MAFDWGISGGAAGIPLPSASGGIKKWISMRGHASNTMLLVFGDLFEIHRPIPDTLIPCALINSISC